MQFRGVKADVIVDQLISAKNSGLHVTANELESHYLAGGNIATVIQAIIQAKQAKIPLPFEKACAIDLAGRDVLDAVNMCVNPRVIKTPLIGGVAKDGIQIKAMARITVKADINKLINLLVELVKLQLLQELQKVYVLLLVLQIHIKQF